MGHDMTDILTIHLPVTGSGHQDHFPLAGLSGAVQSTRALHDP
jgi:hypothetical protein